VETDRDKAIRPRQREAGRQRCAVPRLKPDTAARTGSWPGFKGTRHAVDGP